MINNGLSSLEKSERDKLWMLNVLLLLLTAVGLAIFIYFFLGFNEKMLSVRVYFFNSLFFLAAITGSCLLYIDFILKKSTSIAYCYIGIIALVSMMLGIQSTLIIFLWGVGFFHLLFLIFFSSGRRMELVSLFLLYLLLPLFIGLSTFFLVLSGYNYPLVYDEYLMAIDGTLGLYPSLIFGQLNEMLPKQLLYMINLTYLALPLFFIIIYKIRQSTEHTPSFDFIIEALFLGIVGYALYSIIPACGSKFAFHSSWPDFVPAGFLENSPQLISCSITKPRNCIPSLHTAWLICLIRNASLCGRITKIFMAIISIGNFIAMFGIGAHYLVDIIVGFSFANILGGVFAFKIPLSHPARWQAIILGTSLFIGWYLLILYGLAFLQMSKILAWSSFLGSVGISIWLEHKLIKAIKIWSVPDPIYCQRRVSSPLI